MQRLHAGDHAELAEAWDVLRRGGLNVLDAWAAIFGVIYPLGVFVGVEHRAHAQITDGVCEKAAGSRLSSSVTAA